MYATIDNITSLFRPLTNEEEERANALLPIVEDILKQEAKRRSKDLDEMLENGELLENVLISVIVDIVSRTLLTSTKDEPMTQYSQSALGYSVSGSYLVPGGGIFVKKSELARLGLKNQKAFVVNLC